MRAVVMSELDKEQFLKLRSRNLALGQIVKTRVGEVEGVKFDLRHSKIDPDEWTMDHLGFFDGYPPSRSLTLPFIWFHWYGKFDKAQLREDVKQDCKDLNRYNMNPSVPREAFGPGGDDEYKKYLSDVERAKPLGATWIKQTVSSRTPEASVNQGDEISLSRVEMLVSDDDFLPLHDRAEIRVYVKIRKTSGRIILLKQPIIMYGATRFTYRHGNKKIYSIMERVRRHFGISNLSSKNADEISGNFERNGYEYEALYRASSLYEDSIRQIQKYDAKTAEGDMSSDKALRSLDDACMLGYAWAYFEQYSSMRKFAEVGLKSVSRAIKGGKSSGETRRRTAEETWRPHALSLAQTARLQFPNLSNEKMANAILGGWRLKIEKPAHSTLRVFIAEQIKLGFLTGKAKSKNR